MKWTEMCFVVPVQSWRFLLKSARCLLCDLAPFPTVPPCQTVIRRSNYRWFAAYYMAFTSRSIRFSPVTCSNHFTHFQLDLFDFFWLEWCVTTIAWNKPRCWVCCLECCKLPEYFFFRCPEPQLNPSSSTHPWMKLKFRSTLQKLKLRETDPPIYIPTKTHASPKLYLDRNSPCPLQIVGFSAEVARCSWREMLLALVALVYQL